MKQVYVKGYQLYKGVDNSDSDVLFASRILNQCCIWVTKVESEPPWGEPATKAVLNFSSAPYRMRFSTSLTPREKDELNLMQGRAGGSIVQLYYIEGSDGPFASRASSYHKARSAGLSTPVDPSIVMYSDAGPDGQTLAHELAAHILLNEFEHRAGGGQDLMVSTATGVELTEAQCDDIRRNGSALLHDLGLELLAPPRQ